MCSVLPPRTVLIYSCCLLIIINTSVPDWMINFMVTLLMQLKPLAEVCSAYLFLGKQDNKNFKNSVCLARIFTCMFSHTSLPVHTFQMNFYSGPVHRVFPHQGFEGRSPTDGHWYKPGQSLHLGSRDWSPFCQWQNVEAIWGSLVSLIQLNQS